jgi:hypothetical protein
MSINLTKKSWVHLDVMCAHKVDSPKTDILLTKVFPIFRREVFPSPSIYFSRFVLTVVDGKFCFSLFFLFESQSSSDGDKNIYTRVSTKVFPIFHILYKNTRISSKKTSSRHFLIFFTHETRILRCTRKKLYKLLNILKLFIQWQEHMHLR